MKNKVVDPMFTFQNNPRKGEEPGSAARKEEQEAKKRVFIQNHVHFPSFEVEHLL